MSNEDSNGDERRFKREDCSEEAPEEPLKSSISDQRQNEEDVGLEHDSGNGTTSAELDTSLPGPSQEYSNVDDLIAAATKICVTTSSEDTLHGLSISDSINVLENTDLNNYFGQATSSNPETLPAYGYEGPSLDQPSSEARNINIPSLDVHSGPVESSSLLRQHHLVEYPKMMTGNLAPASAMSEPTDPIWVARTDLPTSSSTRPVPVPDEPVVDQQLNGSVQPEEPPVTNHDESERDVSIPSDAMNAMMDIPGPCEPEDLIEGIIFSANYLGTTQLPVSQSGLKNSRMLQAQEALNRIKVSEGDSQPSVLVDLFISTSKIKILDADNQQSMMSHSLRSISYVADIGDLLVIMAKPQNPKEDMTKDEDGDQRKDPPKRSKVICHVLFSTDSHLIAESVGQCFSIAYQQFLLKNSIEPQNLSRSDFSQFLDAQEMYHDDLLHYSKKENTKEIWVEKKKGEAMGIAIVESGWGSIIPTVILANLQHSSPMERNGKFSIGDQIMSINGTSLVGLPLQTCHSIIKGLRDQTLVKVNIVSCPPVVSVLIKRPGLQHQLGFSVQNGVICSLMRGGIAERGGVRVGHRIIEINHQSVVATPHDKIVQMLVTSVGEIQMKTMPSSMYRLLTGQEQPIFL